MEGTGITVKTGDSIETGQNGGQTISCTKGSYWIDQAISVPTIVPLNSVC